MRAAHGVCSSHGGQQVLATRQVLGHPQSAAVPPEGDIPTRRDLTPGDTGGPSQEHPHIQRGSHQPFATPQLLFCTGGLVPTSPQGSHLPQCHVAAAPMLGRAKPVCKTHPELEKPLAASGGTCHRGSGDMRQEATAMSHPLDPPMGVEEDVDEHGGNGGQRVGGHGQDAEAGLGALHRVQRGAGGCQGDRHPSGLGTAQGQSRSATPWPPPPPPSIPPGTRVARGVRMWVQAGASRTGPGGPGDGVTLGT